MKIIGHRGASSLALENSLEAIKAAVAAGVDGVEFDVRLSADSQFFLSHDSTLGRVADRNLSIKDSSSSNLANIRLHNGESVPRLEEALLARGDTLAVIEAKGSRWADALVQFINVHQPANIAVIAFNHPELGRFHKAVPGVACYMIERTKAIETMRLAHQNQLAGVDLNFWLLNPFTYWYARYLKLDLLVYTVNSRLVAWYFRLLFPNISITTDVPQRMHDLRH